MLRKLLVIGLGGAGGMTVRHLRQQLTSVLARAGSTAPFPSSWQLLQIDVPAEADGNWPGAPAQLPGADYLGLAGLVPPGGYDQLDAKLVGADPVRRAAVAGWRPDPRRVHVNVAQGSGQRRPIGRVACGAGIDRVAARLDAAVTHLTSVGAASDHHAVQQVLGVQVPAGPAPDPSVVIVASLGGGAGSGMFLDVCDLLRAMAAGHPNRTWLRDTIAILFAPDVFDEIDERGRWGVAPNALAAICELTAATWDLRAFDLADQVILGGADVVGGLQAGGRRGPAWSFLVGRSSDRIVHPGQLDVYRSTGRMLAALATRPEVQDQLAYRTTHWALTADSGGEAPFLAAAHPKALSAMGHSSLGLGRDRFARYASERLARACVERLLRGHDTFDVAQRVAPEAARDEVERNLDLFVDSCGLDQHGRERNQILDGIRDRERLSQELRALEHEWFSRLQAFGPMPPGDWAIRINAMVGQTRSDFLERFRSVRESGARIWCLSTQERVLTVTNRCIAELGLPVTVELLRGVAESSGELSRSIAELHDLGVEHRRRADTVRSGVEHVLGAWQGNHLPAGSDLIRQALHKAAHEVWQQSEAETALLAAELSTDLRQGFLAPLHRALHQALAALVHESTDGPDTRSAFSAWPHEDVGIEMLPAANEVLLEGPDTYRTSFELLVTATTGEPSLGAAEPVAIAEIVTGLWEGHDAAQHTTTGRTALVMERPWTPRHSAVGGGQAAPADVRSFLSLADVLARACDWVRQPNRAIGSFVYETLDEYLDPGDLVPFAEGDRRRQRFAHCLRSALEMAEPTVHIDRIASQELYGRQIDDPPPMITPLPFPAGHPAREPSEVVLLAAGIDQGLLANCFGVAPAADVHITRMWAAPADPLALPSLTRPIRTAWAQAKADGRHATDGFWTWRRTQPLDKFVPVPPDVLAAMVRGWFTARILGWAPRFDPRSAEEPWVMAATGRRRRFPQPYLGPAPDVALDVLPALLESLPLAMLGFADGDREPASAYARLQELGTGRDLDRWIRSGGVGERMLPSPTLAGPAGDGSSATQDRSDACAQTFRQQVELFDRAVDIVEQDLAGAEEFRPVPRYWELRGVIRSALVELVRDCRRVPEENDL